MNAKAARAKVCACGQRCVRRALIARRCGGRGRLSASRAHRTHFIHHTHQQPISVQNFRNIATLFYVVLCRDRELCIEQVA
ncbi:unnamed protein product [Arctia plantaginis]|uniref:Uncharacterized protein n=1 Tax=Arctia plantaginis TaxID=874455 RepID=A0A8S0YYF8_ARCPL|nr:unnamed protein product [Arctia plantaginis]CAB3256649.1 unnamed protein product [Arctia plantaginis]